MHEPGKGLGADEREHGIKAKGEARGKADDQYGEVNAIEHRDPPRSLLLDEPTDEVKAQAVQPDYWREGQEKGKGLGLQGRAQGKARDDERLAEGGQQSDEPRERQADAQNKTPYPGCGLRASGKARGELGGKGLGGVEKA